VPSHKALDKPVTRAFHPLLNRAAQIPTGENRPDRVTATTILKLTSFKQVAVTPCLRLSFDTMKLMLPRIRPMRLRLVKEPFDDPDYLFELKHDGFRAVAYVQNSECKLISRNLRALRFASLKKEMTKMMTV